MDKVVEDAIESLLKLWSDQGYAREDLIVDEGRGTITVNVPHDDNAYMLEFDEFVEIVDELTSAKVDAEKGFIQDEVWFLPSRPACERHRRDGRLPRDHRRG